MTSRPSLVATVEGGALEFEVVRPESGTALGVVRRLKLSGAVSIEMNLLFGTRDAFVRWLACEEYRHQAPGLMAFVKNRFDDLYDAAGTIS